MNKYKRPLVLVGSRSDMEPYIEIAEELGIPILGILDRFYVGNKLEGLDVIGSDLDLINPDAKDTQDLIEHADFFVASFFGGRTNLKIDNENTFLLRMQRIDLVKQARCNLINLIHPDCNISRTARLGRNTLVLPGAYIESHVNIGSFCQFMYHSGVAHHTIIGENCTFLPDSGTTGSVNIGNNVLVGINSRILSSGASETKIGDNVIIGPALTILKDIPENKTILLNGKIVTNENFTDEVYEESGIASSYNRIN
jgi:UDP-3-O-[3-hydroxymyristoyl] glucosamine N-acyltransferase